MGGKHLSESIQGHSKVQATSMQSLAQRFGEEAAADVLNFSRKHVYALKRVVEEEGLDCEFELRRSYDVYCNDGEAEAARSYIQASQKAGQQWADEVDFIEGKLAEQVRTMKLLSYLRALKTTRSPLSKAPKLRAMSQLVPFGHTNWCRN